MTLFSRTALLKIANLILLLVFVLQPLLWGQNRNLRKTAEQYIESKRYNEAADILKSYCPTKPKDVEAWFWLAKSQYEINQLEAAIHTLQYIEGESKKDDPETILLYAQTLHQLHQFAAAITYYKRFLAIGEKDKRFHTVVNEVKRCAVGLRLNYISDAVLVENMGSVVNSRYDDFHPLESPNYNGRIYFSSTRSLRIQDRFSDTGTWMESVQGFDTDMFGTQIENGAWIEAEALNPRLNTPAHEVLQGFSEDGMALFFSRSSQLDQEQFWIDTFDANDQESIGHLWGQNPFQPGENVRGIYFFNDTILFFSSARTGGFGGYDLYYSRKVDTEWTVPSNLGDRINSAYDEVTPFICKDGRTLYFSSNRNTSMGGFDVFESRFDERSNQWPKPSNLGRPLNSAGNDLFFRISTNGLMAVLSSDRKSGLGGHDIYSAYFKQPQRPNLSTSTPNLFFEVRDFQLFNESLVGMQESNRDETDLLMDVFKVPFLLYRDDQVLTPQNKPKIEKLVGFLQTYPHLSVEIICHSDQTDVSNFDLFFSIKRAEQIASFLQSKGVKPNSIYLRGAGGNYPIALNQLAGKDNESGRFYNRRIDFRIHYLEQVPMQIEYELPEFMESMRDAKLNNFYEREKGLSYRVQFVALDQLFKGDLIGKYADSFIEKNPDSKDYAYSSGLFKIFKEALNHLSKIKEEGFDDAKIIPYLDGMRLQSSNMQEGLLQDYPDLRNYMLYLK